MKLILKRTSVIIVDILLLVFFTRGFIQFVDESTPYWLTLIYIIGIAVSGFLLIGWLVPKIRRQLWFWRANLWWVLGWLAYFCIMAGILIIAINRLASLG